MSSVSDHEEEEEDEEDEDEEEETPFSSLRSATSGAFLYFFPDREMAMSWMAASSLTESFKSSFLALGAFVGTYVS